MSPDWIPPRADMCVHIRVYLSIGCICLSFVLLNYIFFRFSARRDCSWFISWEPGVYSNHIIRQILPLRTIIVFPIKKINGKNRNNLKWYSAVSHNAFSLKTNTLAGLNLECAQILVRCTGPSKFMQLTSNKWPKAFSVLYRKLWLRGLFVWGRMFRLAFTNNVVLGNYGQKRLTGGIKSHTCRQEPGILTCNKNCNAATESDP